mgnify:CR=1 FL=1
MLEMHQLVELQTILNLHDLGRIGLEDVVHIVTAFKVPGIMGEGAPAELLDLIELGAFLLHLFGDAADEIVDTGFIPLRVEDDQAPVLPVRSLRGLAHRSSE